jgi:hypothetical protein
VARSQNAFYGELAAGLTLDEFRKFLSDHRVSSAEHWGGHSPTEREGWTDWRVVHCVEWCGPTSELESHAVRRRFPISLRPGAFLSRDKMIDLFVASKGASYASFMTLQGIVVATSWSGGDDWFVKLPAGRAEVTVDPSLSFSDKRALGRLFGAMVDAAHSASGGTVQTHNEAMLAAGRALYRPQSKRSDASSHIVSAVAAAGDGSEPVEGGEVACEWLERPHPHGAGLSSGLARAVAFGVGEQTSERPSDALPSSLVAYRLSEYCFSIGRFSPGISHVVCEHGAGEIPQLFSRVAAVAGATYVLQDKAVSWAHDGAPPVAPRAPSPRACLDNLASQEAVWRIDTNFGSPRCRMLCVSPGHMPIPLDRVSGNWGIIARALVLGQSASSPLPVRADASGAPMKRLLAVFPPRTLDPECPFTISALLGDASDSLAPSSGDHWQMNLWLSSVVDADEDPGSFAARVASLSAEMLGHLQRATELLKEQCGGTTNYSAGWVRVEPPASVVSACAPPGALACATARIRRGDDVCRASFEPEERQAWGCWRELWEKLGLDVSGESSVPPMFQDLFDAAAPGFGDLEEDEETRTNDDQDDDGDDFDVKDLAMLLE